jgi:hypothetical protein
VSQAGGKRRLSIKRSLAGYSGKFSKGSRSLEVPGKIGC